MVLRIFSGQCLIIIAITCIITLVTALSTSAITTNGEIGGGKNCIKLGFKKRN